MVDIYLVRHVQADGNKFRRCQSWYNSGITKLGEQQSELVALRFKDIHIDAVYSSDLYRAKRTAMPLARQKKLPVNIRPGLREISMGVMEDVHWTSANSIASKYREYLEKPWETGIDGGESLREVGERMVNTVSDIACIHPGQTIAIFSHGAAIRCFLTMAMNRSFKEIDSLAFIANTAVAHIVYDNGEFKVKYHNDAGHLLNGPVKEMTAAWWVGFDTDTTYDVTIESLFENDCLTSTGFWDGKAVFEIKGSIKNGVFFVYSAMFSGSNHRPEFAEQLIGEAISYAYKSGCSVVRAESDSLPGEFEKIFLDCGFQIYNGEKRYLQKILHDANERLGFVLPDYR